MFCLAEFYFDGKHGIEQDKDEALKWYIRAIEGGSSIAAERDLDGTI